MNRKSYQRPIITPITALTNSKVGSSRSKQRVRTRIEGVPVNDLVEQYGSPLYVFSERRIRNKVSELRSSFEGRYPKVQLAWSYKTNYLNSICSLFHEEGCIAEVVSEMEYLKARQLGVAGRDIIFNGPYKTLSALQRAVEEGAKIHIDHFDELDDLISLKSDKLIEVGIRLNLDAGIHPQWSRFGFNLESGEARRAAEKIAACAHLTLTGIHCHIGTYITDPAAYGQQVRKMVGFMAEVESRFDFTIDYLDIGGGLPSKSRLKGAVVSPTISVPGVEEYAEEVTSVLYETLPPGRQPTLILESGRFLIDEAGFLLTSVVARKETPEGRPCYVLDGGLHTLFTAFWYRFTIEADRPYSGPIQPSTLYGPLCMNIDVVEQDISLPPLDRGTVLTVSPVGAYNNTQSMQFIHMRPATVLIGNDQQVEVIREAEDLSDLIPREMGAAPMASMAPMVSEVNHD